MWVYPFEFREYIVPFQSISTLAVCCPPIYFRFTVFLLNDVRHTFSYSNKYNQTNYSAGLLLNIIVPTMQHTANNQFGIRHLTYLLSRFTYCNWLHTHTNTLTYLLTNVFQVYLYEREWIWQVTACCIRIETSICRISVKSPLVRSYIKYCISGKSQNFFMRFSPEGVFFIWLGIRKSVPPKSAPKKKLFTENTSRGLIPIGRRDLIMSKSAAKSWL